MEKQKNVFRERMSVQAKDLSFYLKKKVQVGVGLLKLGLTKSGSVIQ